jgi:Cys-rich repeat protein
MRGWLGAFLVPLVVGFIAWSCAAGSLVDQHGVGGAAGATSTSTGKGGAGGGTMSTSSGSGGSGSGGSATGGSATGGSDGGTVNPCEGVPCDTPPPNQCNGSDLVTYASVGTCSGGQCTYNDMTQPCPNGCSNGFCLNFPCLGVTCNNPPTATCLDASTLEVPQAPGTCTGGTCTYGSTQINCPFGCTGNQCANDPCAGKTCNQAAASYCVDPSHLHVRDLPGVCNNGVCTYTAHDEYCAFGCTNGACNGDPCVGVVCPPKANYCASASTLVQYDAGQCISGLPCTYGSTMVPCPNGCVNGQCVMCTTDGQCGSGNWCSNNQCVSCNSDLHCGASCAACSGATPKCNGTTCVACTTNGNCTSGNYCDPTNQCQPCNTPQHCGASCVACSGATPICGASGCVQCAGNGDCGSGTYCSAATCQTCNVDQHCGASCVACGGATPKCSGATCVECTSNADCAAQGKVCGPANTCIAGGCSPPTAACQTSGSQDGGCLNAYVISRTAAGSTSGFTVNNTYGMCLRNNDFTDNTCGGGTGSDAEYKLFMRMGETAAIQLTRGSSTCTIGWAGTISLKIFEAACDAACNCPKTCSTNVYCTQSNSQSPMFVAPADGWYTIVVDTVGPVDDKGGVFYLNVKLACAGGNCACM